ncbi:ATP synthase F0 subunit B [Candidatus Gracilibacteria bacterium]|nr:ATP synthase F0 subunit B [Candidatus Gracilibacteria bacterium]
MDDLNIAIILAQFINFGILFFIFYYFLGKTIVKIIEKRRTQLENLDNSDDVVREKLEEAEKEAKVIIDEARKNASEIQKNAYELSKRDTELKLKIANEKAEGIIQAANREIEKERLGMLSAMKDKVLDLSLKINSKVFDKKDNNKEFISKEVNSIKL